MTIEGTIPAGVVVRSLSEHADGRGRLLELFRIDETACRPKMAYASWTHPGLVRGPHEHACQADLFVFCGPGRFDVFLWAGPNGPRCALRGVGEGNPVQVFVPPGVVHAYRCVGEGDGLVFNAPDQLYAGPHRREVVDEIRHEGGGVFEVW